VALCGQPEQIMKVLQQTLPADTFSLLVARIPVAQQVLTRAMQIYAN